MLVAIRLPSRLSFTNVLALFFGRLVAPHIVGVGQGTCEQPLEFFVECFKSILKAEGSLKV